MTSTRRVLLRDRRRVRSSAERIAAELNAAARSPQAKPDIATSVKKLQATLHSLANELAPEPGSRPQSAVKALKSLNVSLTKLNEAVSASDPNVAMRAFESGLRAFGQATRDAKKAGSDWAL